MTEQVAKQSMAQLCQSMPIVLTNTTVIMQTRSKKIMLPYLIDGSFHRINKFIAVDAPTLSWRWLTEFYSKCPDVALENSSRYLPKISTLDFKPVSSLNPA
jgi:hypothetical protein